MGDEPALGTPMIYHALELGDLGARALDLSLLLCSLIAATAMLV
jgi:hypothetical protein